MDEMKLKGMDKIKILSMQFKNLSVNVGNISDLLKDMVILSDKLDSFDSTGFINREDMFEFTDLMVKYMSQASELNKLMTEFQNITTAVIATLQLETQEE